MNFYSADWIGALPERPKESRRRSDGVGSSGAELEEVENFLFESAINH
jgi:hypothetical protein